MKPIRCTTSWRRSLTALTLALCLGFFVVPARAEQRDAYTFFSGTQYPLTVFFIRGDQPGPTVMVQGGIQGDESAGFVSAQLLSRARVTKGNLVVVPRANVPSINLRARQVNVDMNRRFDKDYSRFYEDRVARVIRWLLDGADAFIHLHEGSGFYSATFVDDLHNPNRYGQSIIVDAKNYQGIDLQKLVGQVLDKLNVNIPNNGYHFHLFDTDTFQDATQYPEMRKSLTCYALSHRKIPAVAVEVSKNILDLGWKVRQQVLAVQLLLGEFGVDALVPVFSEEDVHSLTQMTPTVLVNGAPLSPGRVLELTPGATLSFDVGGGVSSNLDPALAVFASDRPGVNLLNARRMILEPFGKLEIRADGRHVLDAPVKLTDAMPRAPKGNAPIFVCWVNGQPVFVPDGQVLHAVEGDQLILEGIWGSREREIVNFKGFVAQPFANDGQDMGWEIVMEPDNFLDKYRLDSDHKGVKRYEVVRETKGQPQSRFFIDLEPRRVLALRLEDDHGQTLVVPWVEGGEYPLHPGRYTFLDAWSNGPGEKLLPMAAGHPLRTGQQISVPVGDPVNLTMRQATTFQPVGSMTFRPGNLAGRDVARPAVN